MEKTVKILNKTGLHARPASMFVKIASSFKSDISLQVGDQKGNAKSILSILGMGIQQGTDIKISAEGIDAEAAVTALCQAVEDQFGEA